MLSYNWEECEGIIKETKSLSVRVCTNNPAFFKTIAKECRKPHFVSFFISKVGNTWSSFIPVLTCLHIIMAEAKVT